MIIGYPKKSFPAMTVSHEAVHLHLLSFVSERGGVPAAGAGQHGGGPGLLLGK